MHGMLLAVAMLTGPEPGELAVMLGTTGARSEGLELQAGGLVVRAREPGVAFTLIEVNKGRPQLGYVLLLRHRFSAEVPLESSDEAIAEGSTAWSRQTISSDGKTLQVEYQVQVEARTKKIAQQSLSLNKKPVDLSRGKVLLVDLTATPPRWEQRRPELPTDPGEAITGRAADALSRKILVAVKKDRKVREFLEAQRK
ncbi:MAG: hypothetical protein U0840_24710 [Gemmataceae bacterium]